MNQNGLARVDAFKGILNNNGFRNQVKACMGEAAGGFISSMLDLYSGDRYLQGCDPNAVAAECLKAASLGLPIVKALGYGYVVAYKNIPTFIPGWKGLVQLAQNSGKYLRFNDGCVFEGESVVRDRLTGQVEITGTPTGDKAIGYFAYFKLLNGFEKTVYMSREEAEAHGRKYSKAYNNGPWKTDFDAMARKTVIRKLLKYGPMSTKMQQAERYEVEAAQAAAQATVEENANAAGLDLPDLPVVDENGVVMESDSTPAAPGF